MIVHLVTDRRRLAPVGEGVARCLAAQVEYAVEAGVDVVQVRERDLEAGDLATIVADLVSRTRGSRTRVVVNDRLDVALAAGADGVHLRSDSLPVAAVRRLAPRGFLVGRSIHSREESAAVAAEGADYLIAGTLWPSASKPAEHRLLGLERFAEIARGASIPVLAIGGVSIERAAEIAAAGGAGIAGIGLFVGNGSRADCLAVPLRDTVKALRERFDTCGSRS